jgi:hypothetical protein
MRGESHVLQNLQKEGPHDRVKGTSNVDLEEHIGLLLHVQELGRELNHLEIILNHTAFDEGTLVSLD